MVMCQGCRPCLIQKDNQSLTLSNSIWSDHSPGSVYNQLVLTLPKMGDIRKLSDVINLLLNFTR